MTPKPRIVTDEMVDRYLAAMSVNSWTTREGVRANLEAALDRRVGDKCRRVEWDDTDTRPGRRKLGCRNGVGVRIGRRNTDPFGEEWADHYTKKSSRLAREAAEAEEIPVSEGVTQAGINAFHYDWTPKWGHPERHAEMARAYRAAAKLLAPREMDGIEAEALSAFYGNKEPHNNWSERERLKMARALYAMERVRREELKAQEPVYRAEVLWGPREPAPYGAKDARQDESAARSSWSHTRGGRIYQHRRADDPK